MHAWPPWPCQCLQFLFAIEPDTSCPGKWSLAWSWLNEFAGMAKVMVAKQILFPWFLISIFQLITFSPCLYLILLHTRMWGQSWPWILLFGICSFLNITLMVIFIMCIPVCILCVMTWVSLSILCVTCNTQRIHRAHTRLYKVGWHSKV